VARKGLRSQGKGGVTPSLEPPEFLVGRSSKFDLVYADGARRLTCFYYLPNTWTTRTPLLFVCHGILRDADAYFARWRKGGGQDTRHYALMVPEFSEEHFPGRARYNSGNVYADEDWMQRLPRSEWSFSLIETLFDEYRRATGSVLGGYYMYGHSGGGQFVHRMVAFNASGGGQSRVIHAVAANSGFYTMPTHEEAFPFGLLWLEGTFSHQDLVTFLQAPLTVLLGTADTDPMHRYLNREAPALRQGLHRLARGRAFVAAGHNAAKLLGVTCAWRLEYVKDAGHTDSLMGPAAAAILFPLPDSDPWLPSKL